MRSSVAEVHWWHFPTDVLASKRDVNPGSGQNFAQIRQLYRGVAAVSSPGYSPAVPPEYSVNHT